ncbi:MFS transporter [Pontibacter sp. MBLB2868]|uniref:MFS transporter n=1 Tax=Pontibacter sp. MBLB2868 TaxID=3451555 RepID=UPI003F74C16F
MKAAITEHDKITGNWVLVSATTASAMVFIDGSALNVVLPSLQHDLGVAATDLLWIINAYLLFLASFILLGGTLGDRLGRKKVFMWGIGLFMFASLCCGLAPKASCLIAARSVQGLGGALMVPGSLAIISSHFQRAARGRAIGTWSAVTTMVTVIGPALGGFLADLGWWRAVFFLNLPLGILALLALYYKVPESRDEESGKEIDWTGAVLVVVGLAGITYAFIAAPERGWYSAFVAGALLVGIAAVMLFIWIESRKEHPMVKLELFRNRTFSGANMLTLLLYGALNVGLFLLVLNLVQVQQYTQLQAGIATLPFGLMLILFSRKMGDLAAKYNAKYFLVVGPLVVGIGFLMLARVHLAVGFSNYWTTYLPGILVFGFGMSVTVAPLTTTVMSAVSDRFAGTASGVNNAVSRIAGVLSIAVVGSLAVASFTDNLATQLQRLDLSAAEYTATLAEAGKLGAASVPEVVTPQLKATVAEILDTAFLNSFSLVMNICGSLAFAGAVIVLLFIPSKSGGK